MQQPSGGSMGQQACRSADAHICWDAARPRCCCEAIRGTSNRDHAKISSNCCTAAAAAAVPSNERRWPAGARGAKQGPYVCMLFVLLRGRDQRCVRAFGDVGVWGGGGSRLATAAPLSLLSFLLQQADVTRHLLPYRALGRVDVHWPMPPHLPPSLHIAADRRAWVVEMCQLPRARVSCGASPSFTPPAATVRPYARAPSHRVTACIAPPSSPLPWPQAAARPLRRRHPCFACGRPGSPREPVSKCSMGSCGRHYHWRCLTASPLARVAASGKSAKCQLHYCMACGGSGNAVPMVQCMMCPSAYHARCRPPGTRVVSKKFVLCPRCSTRDPNSTGPSA